MPTIIFNIQYMYPYTSPALPPIIYTELAPELTAMTSVAQSVECWSRDPGSRVQFPALELYFSQLVPVGS